MIFSWQKGVVCFFSALMLNSLFAGCSREQTESRLIPLIKSHNYRLESELLSQGEDPNAKNSFGYGPIEVAILEDDTVSLSLLLKFGANLALPTYGGGVSFLVFALETHKFHAAKFLITHGLSPDFPDKMGNSPLFAAVSTGNVRAVKFLLDAGASPNFHGIDGETALEEAVTIHKIPDMADTTQRLLNNILHMSLNGRTPDDNYLDIIGLLLKAGAYPSAVIDSESGYTPLHQAAKDCDTAVIRLLLKFKADPHAKDKDGMTPLDIAKQYHCDAVEAILTRK